MYAPTGNVPSSRPVLMRFLVRSWEYRHPRAWSVFRVAAGVWNLFLGVVLLASGYWVGIGACRWWARCWSSGPSTACRPVSRASLTAFPRSGIGQPPARLGRCCRSLAVVSVAGVPRPSRSRQDPCEWPPVLGRWPSRPEAAHVRRPMLSKRPGACSRRVSFARILEHRREERDEQLQHHPRD